MFPHSTPSPIPPPELGSRTPPLPRRVQRCLEDSSDTHPANLAQQMARSPLWV
jgi:hypothetical protein